MCINYFPSNKYELLLNILLLVTFKIKTNYIMLYKTGHLKLIRS